METIIAYDTKTTMEMLVHHRNEICITHMDSLTIVIYQEKRYLFDTNTFWQLMDHAAVYKKQQGL